MTTIVQDAPLATVIVTMTCEPDDQAELLALARATEPIFARQPGFISSALHRSTDGRRVLQYLQWRSIEDSNACMMSPDWQSESAGRFMAFIQSGKATLEPQEYEVVSASSAATAR